MMEDLLLVLDNTTCRTSHAANSMQKAELTYLVVDCGECCFPVENSGDWRGVIQSTPSVCSLAVVY
jgi:hypothetical protein